ncbi:uncharacterized protein LOC131646134 [Vicia villosa]|uniref:uncharacterized protein LOC131646134 n=1 Tax=Vicia villosa TaxID=3911 RepID=UPI00273C47FC|nr:uncharacterized protein LOC131646134 [Vicia villosa]
MEKRVEKGKWCSRKEYPITMDFYRRKHIRLAKRGYKRKEFDFIDHPARRFLGGGVGPLSITEEYRPLLVNLSVIALKKYNDDNKEKEFVFEDLVKSTYGVCAGGMYYITFKAKAKEEDGSNTPSITFQGKVWKRLNGPPEIMASIIINGFALHKLHKPKCVSAYHENLS